MLIATVVPTGIGALLSPELEHAASAQLPDDMVDYLRFQYGVATDRATAQSLAITPRLLRTG